MMCNQLIIILFIINSIQLINTLDFFFIKVEIIQFSEFLISDNNVTPTHSYFIILNFLHFIQKKGNWKATCYFGIYNQQIVIYFGCIDHTDAICKKQKSHFYQLLFKEPLGERSALLVNKNKTMI